MEFMVSWFWLLPFVLFLFIAWFGYTSIRKYRETGVFSRWRLFILIIAAIFMISSPIKINSTNSSKINTIQNYNIEASKVTPKKISDNSFRRETNAKSLSITTDEIWNKGE